MSSSTATPPPSSRLVGPEGGRLLALVQNDLVISVFPEHQREAAIDLARVLCRALGQPIRIFQRCRAGGRVETGSAACDLSQGEWTLVAHANCSLLGSVVIAICDVDPSGADEQRDESAVLAGAVG